MPSYKDFLLTAPSIEGWETSQTSGPVLWLQLHVMQSLNYQRAPFFNFNTPLRYKTSAQSSLSWKRLTSGIFTTLAPWWWTADHWSKCCLHFWHVSMRSYCKSTRPYCQRGKGEVLSPEKSLSPIGNKNLATCTPHRANPIVSKHVSDPVSLYWLWSLTL